MNTKRIVIGTLTGGITMYLLGYLIWGLIFADFFDANRTVVVRETTIFWAVVLGNLSLAVLVTLAVVSRADPSTILDGLKIGAIVGFLVWFGVDFIHYGFREASNLTVTITDPLLEIVRTGIVGAVIAAVLGRFANGKGST